MKRVSFEEYEAAKAEIVGGVHYIEKSTMEGNVIRKTYTTEENGTFYEVNENGRVEFWSDKHSESRVYDENERAQFPENVGKVPGYGDLLAEKIKETADFTSLKPFEKFVLDNGYMYDSSEALKAGYDRTWKAGHGIILTEEEFAAEVANHGKPADVSEIYEAIMEHVRGGRLGANDIMQYARFRWCLNNPEAVVAYEVDNGKWVVNNCHTEITEETARLEICEKFGFEASRVEIVGTPYYDATDWNFIRFNCAGWCWLIKDGSIYQVCG